MILYGQKYGNFYFFLGIRQLMKTPIVKCLVHNSWKGNNDIAKPTYLRWRFSHGKEEKRSGETFPVPSIKTS